MALAQLGAQEFSMAMARASKIAFEKADQLTRQGATQEAKTLSNFRGLLEGDSLRFEQGLIDKVTTEQMSPAAAKQAIKMAVDTPAFSQAVKLANCSGKGIGQRAETAFESEYVGREAAGAIASLPPSTKQLELLRQAAAAAPDKSALLGVADITLGLQNMSNDIEGPKASAGLKAAFGAEAKSMVMKALNGPTKVVDIEGALELAKRMPAAQDQLDVLRTAYPKLGNNQRLLEAFNGAAWEIQEKMSLWHPQIRSEIRKMAQASGKTLPVTE